MRFWSRAGKRRKKIKSVSHSRGLRPVLETLERRELLTGTSAPLANPIPDPKGAQLAIQLSDGTVMVMASNGFATNTWYQLSPDSTGSYINGNWSQLASSNVERLFSPTNVLPDGRVFLLGGEY